MTGYYLQNLYLTFGDIYLYIRFKTPMILRMMMTGSYLEHFSIFYLFEN